MFGIVAHALEIIAYLVQSAVTFGNEAQSGAVTIGNEFIHDGGGVVGYTNQYEHFAFVA